MTTNHRGGYRSFFWPIVLITIGVVWLLKNIGLIYGINLGALLRLWPLLLIVIGLDLLFGRRSPLLGALIGLAAAGLVVALIWLAPSLGLVDKTELKTAHFSEPASGVEAAQITLDLSVGTTTVNALSDSNNLIEADLTYLGEVDFTATGESQKTVTLRQTAADFNINLFDVLDTGRDLRWDIGLSPSVPLDLSITGDVGGSEFDLRALDLTGLDVTAGVGEVTLQLPPGRYPLRIDGDVGAFKITIPAGAGIEADINGGVGGFSIEISEGADMNATITGDVGNFTITLPGDSAARISADVSLGNISIPARFERVGGGEREGAGEQGVWETSNYSRADRKITIDVQGDIGNLTVR
ncbi:MAG: LiaI-LiaF-like domain-containing protein [Anaerolineae bacterium]